MEDAVPAGSDRPPTCRSLGQVGNHTFIVPNLGRPPQDERRFLNGRGEAGELQTRGDWSIFGRQGALANRCCPKKWTCPLPLRRSMTRRGQTHFRSENVYWRRRVQHAAKTGTVPEGKNVLDWRRSHPEATLAAPGGRLACRDARLDRFDGDPHVLQRPSMPDLSERSRPASP